MQRRWTAVEKSYGFLGTLKSYSNWNVNYIEAEISERWNLSFMAVTVRTEASAAMYFKKSRRQPAQTRSSTLWWTKKLRLSTAKNGHQLITDGIQATTLCQTWGELKVQRVPNIIQVQAIYHPPSRKVAKAEGMLSKQMLPEAWTGNPLRVLPECKKWTKWYSPKCLQVWSFFAPFFCTSAYMGGSIFKDSEAPETSADSRSEHDVLCSNSELWHISGC